MESIELLRDLVESFATEIISYDQLWEEIEATFPDGGSTCTSPVVQSAGI